MRSRTTDPCPESKSLRMIHTSLWPESKYGCYTHPCFRKASRYRCYTHPQTSETHHSKCFSDSEIHHTRLTTDVALDFSGLRRLPSVFIRLGDLLFEIHDGFGGVQSLRTAVRAIHDTVAPVKLHGIIDPSETLFRELVPRVSDPTVSLHEDGRSQVEFRIPPIGRARGHARSTQNAFVHSVQLSTILRTLIIFWIRRALDLSALQPWLDRLILVVEVGQVWHEIFHDIRMRQRLNLDWLWSG